MSAADATALAAAFAGVALIVTFVVTTPPGALLRTGHHTAKWLNAREVERAALTAAPTPLAIAAPVPETVPDAVPTYIRTA